MPHFSTFTQNRKRSKIPDQIYDRLEIAHAFLNATIYSDCHSDVDPAVDPINWFDEEAWWALWLNVVARLLSSLVVVLVHTLDQPDHRLADELVPDRDLVGHGGTRRNIRNASAPKV